MTTSIVPGSVHAVAASSGKPLALAMMDVEAVVLVDTSASMSDRDSRGGRQRYAVACEELMTLQAAHPGRLAVVSFSGDAKLCPSGVPEFLRGSTDVAGALRFVKPFDVDGTRFLVVSDGEPDSAIDALAEAAKFAGRIDTIYVGPENGKGREFLVRLARGAGGQSATATAGLHLAAVATLLLGSGT